MMSMPERDGLETVRRAVADCLDLRESEVRADSRLFADLDADSLDYLELIFTLERAFGVKLARSDLDSISRLDYGDSEVMRDGKLTPAILARVREWIPAVDGLDPDDTSPEMLWSLVTVETVWRAVRRRIEES
jgi:acyl carrier protein